MMDHTPKKLVPVVAKQAAAINIDGSGQAIVALIKEAADMARDTCERATEKAQQLSVKLRESQDRIKELEAELQRLQVRASDAEKWLLRIHEEIEDRFFSAKADNTGRAS